MCATVSMNTLNKEGPMKTNIIQGNTSDGGVADLAAVASGSVVLAPAVIAGEFGRINCL